MMVRWCPCDEWTVGDTLLFAVTVAGISVTGQTLSAVTSESGNLVGDVADGLMGMAFPALSNLEAVRDSLMPAARVHGVLTSA